MDLILASARINPDSWVAGDPPPNLILAELATLFRSEISKKFRALRALKKKENFFQNLRKLF